MLIAPYIHGVSIGNRQLTIISLNINFRYKIARNPRQTLLKLFISLNLYILTEMRKQGSMF